MAKIQAHTAVAASVRSAPEELAVSLVRCMGRDSAIHVCKLNGWAGVLDMILEEDGSRDGGHGGGHGGSHGGGGDR